MASPRLESMCCINTTEHGQKHHMGAYNITCIVSASLSILGAIYLLLPRKVPDNPRRRTTLGYERQIKIINWLTLADLLACIGILVRSSSWLAMHKIFQDIPGNKTGHKSYMIFCAVAGAWIQYFYITTYFWTLSFAIDIFLLMRNRASMMWLYHVLAWLISAVMCLDGLLSLYFPSLTECEHRLINLLPHYLSTLLPIIMVMIVNPILYIYSARRVSPLLTQMSGKYTDQERLIAKQVKEKFAMIHIVFILCWLPNVVNAFVILCRYISQYKKSGGTDEHDLNDGFKTLDIAMGILNPLQAFLNAWIYRGCARCSEIKLFSGHGRNWTGAINERRPSVRAIPVPGTNQRKGSMPIDRDDDELSEHSPLLC